MRSLELEYLFNNKIAALTEEELCILHEEADILSNHLMSEGYDLIKDFGCVIGNVHAGTI
jgi:hypothetical protein